MITEMLTCPICRALVLALAVAGPATASARQAVAHVTTGSHTRIQDKVAIASRQRLPTAEPELLRPQQHAAVPFLSVVGLGTLLGGMISLVRTRRTK
jgi:hypothetical protein